MSALHECAALCCTSQLVSDRAFCGRHWAMLPGAAQSLVAYAHRAGFCTGETATTPQFRSAVAVAVKLVAIQEGCSSPGSCSMFKSRRSCEEE